MRLSRFERLMLSNQYKILEALYPDEADGYALHREAIERGYELHYPWMFEHVYDDADALSSDECREVLQILEMFSVLKRSYQQLADKDGVEGWRVKFMGFDGNNETTYVAYARYLVNGEGRYNDLDQGDDFNSHMPTLGRYRSMLETWKQQGEPRSLSREQIVELTS